MQSGAALNHMGGTEMEKHLILKDELFQEEFMEIFSIGLLECLKEGLIDTCRAEQWLFSPVIAYSLKKENYSSQFIDAMKSASELDATKDTDYHLISIDQARKLFMDAFKTTIKQSIHPMDHILKKEELVEYESDTK